MIYLLSFKAKHDQTADVMLEAQNVVETVNHRISGNLS